MLFRDCEGGTVDHVFTEYFHATAFCLDTVNRNTFQKCLKKDVVIIGIIIEGIVLSCFI